MALRSKLQDQAKTSEQIGEEIDELQKKMDRCKVLFEQYFMGIQKMPPAQLHRELERRIRELTQLNIRNTALRFRFTTLSQKFGSYNTYWKRVMREIENGTYLRDIAKVGRRAARRGEDIPEEILAKMPKRMRDRILRDRERLANRVERDREADAAARASGVARGNRPKNVHVLSEDELDDVDLDAVFSAIMSDDEPSSSTSAPALEAQPDPKLVAKPTPPPAAAGPKVTPPGAPKAIPPISSQAEKVRVPSPDDPSRMAAKRGRAAPKAPPARARTARPAAPAVKPPPGMSERDARGLYEKYIKARELVGERTDNVTYDKLMRSLNKQAPKIIKDHDAKGVDFNVVVKDDKVVLKAKPKK